VGQQDTRFLATEPLLAGDLVEFAKPWVKWAAEVIRPEDVPMILRRAFKVASRWLVVLVTRRAASKTCSDEPVPRYNSSISFMGTRPSEPEANIIVRALVTLVSRAAQRKCHAAFSTSLGFTVW
jgi:thiamine pyrophosphate-dependent acetolactate synthase large subunit-like protein